MLQNVTKMHTIQHGENHDYFMVFRTTPFRGEENMETDDLFERGKGDWEKLGDFMDENNFSRADMLAVVCASLLKEPEKNFCTALMIQGEKFFIQIKKGYK